MDKIIGLLRTAGLIRRSSNKERIARINSFRRKSINTDNKVAQASVTREDASLAAAVAAIEQLSGAAGQLELESTQSSNPLNEKLETSSEGYNAFLSYSFSPTIPFE